VIGFLPLISLAPRATGGGGELRDRCAMYIHLSCLDLGRVEFLSPVMLLSPECFCLTSVPGLGEGGCSFGYSFKLGGDMGVNFCFLRDDVGDSAGHHLRCSSCEFSGCSSALMAAERRFSMVTVKLLLRQISALQFFSEASGGFSDVSARSILPLSFALGGRSCLPRSWGLIPACRFVC
jgi:hypothetical protein